MAQLDLDCTTDHITSDRKAEYFFPPVFDTSFGKAFIMGVAILS